MIKPPDLAIRRLLFCKEVEFDGLDVVPVGAVVPTKDFMVKILKIFGR